MVHEPCRCGGMVPWQHGENQPMQAQTKTAVAAIIAADASIDKETAAAALRLLSGEKEKPIGRVMRTKEVARLFGVTTVTLRDWARNGVLVPVYGPGKKLRMGYTEESVRAVIAQRGGK